jgi:RHS repeat-associated protein
MVRVTEGTTTTENKYDALGRRLQMIVTTVSQAKAENYYYAGHQVIEVRDGSDQVKRQFIYGNGIDEVIRMDAYNGSTITPYYFHSNAIGSTTAVTDANGQVVERYKYGLYGMPTFMDAAGNVIPKSTIGNNILFQGREYEPETNFYYFRARHLDPIMGRFLSTDPMGYQDSMNLYQAFNQNPVNFVDPFGKQHWIIEEELAGQEALKEHLIKKYGKTKGEMEFNQIMGNQRRIETKMVASFFLATGGMLIAPHLSGPALVATVGSISTYSALESYSSRKQAGQTEKEAKRGAFGAATGFNFLFNLMGFDYGTLEKASQEQVEDAWSTLVGGVAGGWLAKMFSAPGAVAESEIISGSGPQPGVIEVSDRVKSTSVFENYNPRPNPNYGGAKITEYVYDPKAKRFATGRTKPTPGASPHQRLASAIEADESTVLGGTLSRGLNGELITTEHSGHYGTRWTQEFVKEFITFIEDMVGIKVIHKKW